MFVVLVNECQLVNTVLVNNSCWISSRIRYQFHYFVSIKLNRMGNTLKAAGLKSPTRCDLLSAELNAYVEQLEINNAETKDHLQGDYSLGIDEKSALKKCQLRLLLLDQSHLLSNLSGFVSESKRQFRDIDLDSKRSSYTQDAPTLIARATRAEAESKVLISKIERLRITTLN